MLSPGLAAASAAVSCAAVCTVTVAFGQLVGVTGGSGLPAALVDGVGLGLGVTDGCVAAGGFGATAPAPPPADDACADFADALADREALRDACAAARDAAFELSAELAATVEVGALDSAGDELEA
jgi:hypothetical protein